MHVDTEYVQRGFEASSFLQSQSLKLWNNEDYKGIWIEDDMEYGGHNVWVHNVKIFNIP